MNTLEHDGCCEEYNLNAPANKCHNCPRLKPGEPRHIDAGDRCDGGQIVEVGQPCVHCGATPDDDCKRSLRT